LPLVALGCVMMRVCNLDTCPAGIATQNPELRKRFAGQPEHVVNLLRFIGEDLRKIMASLGFRTLEEMVGRSDLLEFSPIPALPKSATIDMSRILHRPEVPATRLRTKRIAQDHDLESTFDSRILVDLCAHALEGKGSVSLNLPITNMDRVVGTLLGYELTKRHGAAGLPEDTIRLSFAGSAGQSFGAFLPPGITMRLEGDANDYVGKGLSGGRLIMAPPPGSGFVANESVIIGNVALYGATKGEAFVSGRAGERFCVRNSGATAVVEGVGDHGCEYMTGGRVAILGRTGRNFAAGMSGGVAFVLDEEGSFALRCNDELVERGPADKEDLAELKSLVERHVALTGSEVGKRLLGSWAKSSKNFVKVMPRDYRRARDALKLVEASGMRGDAARLAAFEAVNKELARASGN